MNITRGKVAKAQKVVIYGPEGIGKSSLAAQFPDPLFSDTEGSTGNMDVARLDKPSSWTMLNQQSLFVKTNKPCKTFVIDTIDWAERMAIDHLCNENQKKSIEDFGYGSGYIKLEEELGRFLNLLSDIVDIGINVVLLAHAQIRKFEQPDEMGAYDRYELKLGKKTSARTSSLVKEWADMVLFINYKTYSVAVDDKGKKHKGQGGVRTVYATHHPAWDAKNRHGLPDDFPLDYSYLAPIFNGVATQQQPVMTPPASPAPPVIQEPAIQQPAPQPIPVQQPLIETPPVTSKLDPAIPASLRDLMALNGVSEEEIQVVVSQKGYYPMGTPIANYDPGFIDGVLIAAWPQVFNMVKDFRKSLPFS